MESLLDRPAGNLEYLFSALEAPKHVERTWGFREACSREGPREKLRVGISMWEYLCGHLSKGI